MLDISGTEGDCCSVLLYNVYRLGGDYFSQHDAGDSVCVSKLKQWKVEKLVTIPALMTVSGITVHCGVEDTFLT